MVQDKLKRTPCTSVCTPRYNDRMNIPPTSTSGAASEDISPRTGPPIVEGDIYKKKKKKNAADAKSVWVTVFKCFQCRKSGHNLPKCTQCSQAYYCNADCQRKHWKKHKPACQAAVAALARHAHRLSSEWRAPCGRRTMWRRA